MDREPEKRKNGVARKGLSGPHVPLFFSENGSRKTMPEAYLPLAPLPIDNFYISNT
jgi:hypothetical protein